MRKKMIIIATAVMSLTLAGCYGYNHRYAGSVYYDDYGDDYGWDPYPAYSLSFYGVRGYNRHSQRRHHRHGGYRRW